MLKVSTILMALALMAAPLSQASDPATHEDKAAAPGAKESHPDSDHAQADAHAPHKPRHGANLHLLPAPKAMRELATRPSLPALQSPAALAKVSGATVMLKWTPAKGAETYHVQVATDPNFKWLVANEPHFKGTEFEAKGLEAGNQYFWRVAGMKNTNIAEYVKGDFVSSSFEISK